MPSYIQSILQNANGEWTKPYLFPLREIAARIGADQWHQKGVQVDLLKGCGDGKNPALCTQRC